MFNNYKFIPLAKPSISAEAINEVIDTLNSAWITTGPKTKQFEKNLAKYCNSKRAVALSSCTAALHMALLAYDIGPGDEVITTPLTFAATANVIEHVGAKPIFVDIDETTLNIDVLKIKKNITAKTKAIIPVDMAGIPCNIIEIMKIAKQHNLKVIQDSAHSIGASIHNKKIGSIADVTCFSFYATKNLTTIEGGAILTNDELIADKIRVLSLHGMSKDAWKRYSSKKIKHWKINHPGWKYNFTDVQASLGIHQLKKIDEINRFREKIHNKYIQTLESIDEISFFKPQENFKSSNHLSILNLDLNLLKINRDEFMELMAEKNIGTGLHFPSILNHPYYNKKYYNQIKNIPIATKLSKQLVSIPLFPDLKEEEIEYIIESIKEIISKNKK